MNSIAAKHHKPVLFTRKDVKDGVRLVFHLMLIVVLGICVAGGVQIHRMIVHMDANMDAVTQETLKVIKQTNLTLQEISKAGYEVRTATASLKFTMQDNHKTATQAARASLQAAQQAVKLLDTTERMVAKTSSSMPDISEKAIAVGDKAIGTLTAIEQLSVSVAAEGVQVSRQAQDALRASEAALRSSEELIKSTKPLSLEILGKTNETLAHIAAISKTADQAINTPKHRPWWRRLLLGF